MEELTTKDTKVHKGDTRGANPRACDVETEWQDGISE
jgi:hypothetical protein